MRARERLLASLEGVRQTSEDQWIARCPAHDDRAPSLSIKDTGRQVLMHCFAGCITEDVLAAIGLTFSDLYVDPVDHGARNRSPQPRVDYRAAFKLAMHEALVLTLAAGDLDQGKKLSAEDLATVREAMSNLCRLAEGGR